MFNTKRIIFLIGLLSLVTLTGALLAGPAFAEPKSSEHAKTLICHYNDAEVVDEDTGDLLEAIGWYFRNVDTASVEDHMLNHGVDAANMDFVIAGSDRVCDTVEEDLDGEADAREQAEEDRLQALEDEADRLDALED